MNFNNLRSLLIVIAMFCSCTAFAQNPQQKTDSIFALVKKYFNAQQADSLYALGNEQFKISLPFEPFKDFFDKQLFPLNEIKESARIDFDTHQVGTYKLVFDAATLQLKMSLDANSQLNLFLFQPYKEPVPNKTETAATSNQLTTPEDKTVEAVVRSYIQKTNTVGLSIGIIKDGKISTYYYGETTKGNGKLPTSNTIFEIGSVTKTFTATLLAYYANEGKVKLTDPITKYLPDSVAANKSLHGITLLMLSNHTSGLDRMPGNFDVSPEDELNPYRSYTKPKLFSYLKTAALGSKPGEKYEYSNLGMGLLGAILAQVSGKTYEQMITDIICKPLQMQNTVQHFNPVTLVDFATVYNEKGDATQAWNFDVLAPCGALRSTINDMLKYVEVNMMIPSGKLGKAIELTHQTTFDKEIKIGMAWHIIDVNGVPYYFHNGGTYGSSSFIAFNTQKNLAVVLLSNAAESTDAIGKALVQKLQ